MEKQKFNPQINLKKPPPFSGFLFLLLLLLSGFTTTNLNAQDKVSGQVTDSSGETLIGANLVQKGTNNGVSTDLDGNYSIVLVPGERVLVFSYTGYEPQEITLGTNPIVNVVLEESSSQLDEVVVIGYAPVSRKKVLGALSSLKEDEIVQATPIGAFDAVQGRLSGVQILSNGGPEKGELKVDVSSVTGINSLVGDIRVSNTRQRILYERLSAVFQQLVERVPYFPIFEPNGDLSPEINARQNPVAETERNIKTRNFRAQTFSYAQLEILPNFSLKSTLGINYRLNKLDDFQPTITINPRSGIPIGRQRFNMSYDVQQENYFNYKKSWDNHEFGAFAGMQVQKY